MMVQTVHKMVPSVYILIKNRDKKILAILRKKTGYTDEYWGIPAGHVEKEELPLKAAVREVLEETGLLLDVNSLKFVTIGLLKELKC